MNDFEFISPTKIYFGKDYQKKVGKVIKDYGFKKVAFIYGKGSIKKNHLYEDVIDSLKENHCDYVEVFGVEANPKLSFIKKAIAQLRKENIDFILAVGGGSVIDTAKSISHALNYLGDPFDFNIGIAKSKNIIPVGVILTIAAAGSELSDSCVISNDVQTPFIKKGFNDDSNRPLFAILNPKITYSVSTFQTGCGIVDTLMHTLERYMNENDSCMLSEQFCFGLIKTVLHYGKIAINDPTNYEARAELMLASSLSHNGLTGLGKKQFMRVHGLEHILSGFYDEVAHGAGLSVLWPAWCLKVISNPKANQLLTQLAKEVFHKETAVEGILALKQYFKEIHMPTSLSELSLKKPLDIEKMALAYSNNKAKKIHDFISLGYDEFIEIFQLARE